MTRVQQYDIRRKSTPEQGENSIKPPKLNEFGGLKESQKKFIWRDCGSQKIEGMWHEAMRLIRDKRRNLAFNMSITGRFWRILAK